MKSSFLYSLKVWLTAVFTAPVLISFVALGVKGIFFILFANTNIWLISFTLSVPALLLFTFLINILAKKGLDIQDIKLISIIASAILITFTFITTTGGLDKNAIAISAIYWVCSCFGILIYRLERKPTSTPTNIEP